MTTRTWAAAAVVLALAGCEARRAVQVPPAGGATGSGRGEGNRPAPAGPDRAAPGTGGPGVGEPGGTSAGGAK